MTMQLTYSLEAWAGMHGGNPPPTVVTIGNFDGLHLGHQKIVRGMVERARELDALATALTFHPHPLKVLRPDAAPPMITPLSQRLLNLERMGLDAALVLPFDLELSRLSAEEFVRHVLAEKLRVRSIFVGANFRFGHKQAGDVDLLAELGHKLRFEVQIVPPLVLRGEIVSSTAIRKAVQNGETSHAARLLGRPFYLTGEIRSGTGTGRRLVVPTLNLTPEQELLPRMGVYATETWLGARPDNGSGLGLPNWREGAPGRLYRSVSNVGMRPTFDGKALTVETHLFDFSEEVKHGWMVIEFWKRLRDEKKFAGPEALTVQIHRDVARAQTFFRRLDRFRHTQKARSAE